MTTWPGTCEKFGYIHCGEMAEWIKAIPLTEWPQQCDPKVELRPAMQHELNWHGFGLMAEPLLSRLSRFLPPNARTANPMLSVVMPGHDIKPHRDTLGIGWMFRVHVPLITNRASKFIIEGEEFQMMFGTIYRVNISREHSVTNNGAIPRIHFMFDCYEGTPTHGHASAT